MPFPQSETVPLEGAEALLKDRLRELLERTRERTLWLVEPVSDDDAERVHSDLMSPLVWDLGHIAAFEDLWLGQRAGGTPPLHPELMDVYDATETPRARRGELPYLHRAEALAYLETVRERSLDELEGADLSPDGPRLTADGFVFELVVAHEQQHTETMLQTLQLAEPGVYAPARRPLPSARDRAGGRVRIESGRFELGARATGFAYDNERPRHEVELDAFEIDRLPVTNGEYMEFVDAGGYHRREWWSDAGWAWRASDSVERPLYWTADGRERRFDRVAEIDPDAPVMHVSWYEADAFARSRAKRLPTEAEWERAAGSRRFPWGDDELGERANLDQTGFGPAAAGAYPSGASPDGVLGLAGDAWEWTASDFSAYPGFAAFPYEEYSAIFFGHEFKVLRGGSWATRAHVARDSFRNWDYPFRRQIFCGFRCARDA